MALLESTIYYCCSSLFIWPAYLSYILYREIMKNISTYYDAEYR